MWYSHFKERNRDVDRPAIGAPSKGQAKREPRTTPSEETASIGPRNANVHLEKHAHSSNEPDRKTKGMGRPRSLSLTGSPHRNSKGDGTSGDDGGAEGTPKITGKSQ